ncbi:hypothetical protein ACFVIM_35120, partial [Streptomyces sp. NPDC057638]|uniref:hypothetical protein n=1 Tax=Streptomyces sp. NPDC057638 TaxID=3346190 RepID=UPI00368F773C
PRKGPGPSVFERMAGPVPPGFGLCRNRGRRGLLYGCKERTTTVGVRYAVEAAHQKRLIRRHARVLESVRALNEAAPRRVSALLPRS